MFTYKNKILMLIFFHVGKKTQFGLVPKLKTLISIKEGNLTEIELRLSMGESTEVTGQYGNTPLIFAAAVRIHII